MFRLRIKAPEGYWLTSAFDLVAAQKLAVIHGRDVEIVPDSREARELFAANVPFNAGPLLGAVVAIKPRAMTAAAAIAAKEQTLLRRLFGLVAKLLCLEGADHA